MNSSGINPDIDKQTEVLRVQHLLQLPVSEDSEYLEKLSAENLAHLGDLIAGSFMHEQDKVYRSLAAVAKFMPDFINARVAQEILGPRITAAITGALPVKKAVAVAGHLSIDFLTKTSEYLLPFTVKKLVSQMPESLLRQLVAQLEAGEKWYIMASFVDEMQAEQVLNLMTSIQHEQSLLLIAGYSRKKHLIAGLVPSLTDDKLQALIAAAVFNRLWSQLFSIARLLSSEQKIRLRAIIAGLEEDFIQAAKERAASFDYYHEIADLFAIRPEN